MLGGDKLLWSCLNDLSTFYWNRQHTFITQLRDTKSILSNHIVDDSCSLSLAGNGAVCSAFTAEWPDLPCSLIAKRIHPYLHSHSSKEAWKEVQDPRWSETIGTSDYVKSFLLDYFIPHDFPHPSLVHNYGIHSAYLRYTTDDLTDPELETYYMLVEKLSDSLDHYINSLDQVNGIGYYDTLCVLLRLAIALVHCHRHGIVHNDIKPDNIMLTSEMNDYEIRLIDFGESFLGFDVLSSMDSLRKGNAQTKYAILIIHYYHTFSLVPD